MQVKKINCFHIILVILVFELNYILCVKTIECGYKQCPQTRDGALNVHLIPHSHMDAGWVKTFDEYYFGTKTSISTANVQLIYHSVLSELLHDKRRKFTFSETAYFWRWWKEQRGAMRATFRTLVQEGRVEFAGGGWVHNDEATPDYLQIIDQYTWGLRKLNDTLGPCGKPKAAWQIDAYGHTREQVSLLAQMGFDGLFIGRVDHKERELMTDEDRMEFMWRGSDTLGKMSDIMTHTLFNLYNAPEGFCFDFLCNDEPIVDDPDSRLYNADQRVNDFIIQVEKQAKYYDHDNIMVTMGGDFTYQSASNWFMNMDKLINHVNTHPANLSDINIFYSTPSCYLKAIYLYGRRDKAIFTERGDHLPYGSDDMTYWTGYYTSRPALKYLARKAHMFLQMMKQLTVISRLSDSYELHLLRHAVSLALHHDAITGTSQQHVSNDFTRILSEALETSSKKVSTLLSYLTPTWGGSRRSKNNQQFVICHQLNMSQCRFTETQDTLLVLVYNPLSVKTYYHVRFPIVPLHYSIRDYNDEEVEYQLVSLPAAVINLPGRSSSAIQEICFEAENIPPLGFTSYYISPIRDQGEDHQFSKRDTKAKNEEQETISYISNEYIKVTVDKSTGLLESVQLLDGTKIAVSQNFYFYAQSQQSLQSGAYSFRPQQERPVAVIDKATYHTIRGNIVKEIRQRFNDWITQIIRLYRGEEYVELEYIIGPVPIGTDLGKEVVSIFSTNISSSGQFFTDSNARQMMRRTCWNETNMSEPHKKPVAACYYPVSSRLCIYSMNSSVEMCVLPDRTQGGTSYNDGEVELMVHRRLLTDDGFGLEEALNEEAYGVGLVVIGKHRIKFGNYKQDVEDQSFSERVSQSAKRWQYEPWVFFSSGQKLSRRKWQNVRNKRFSALRVRGLPRHIHILTLEPWKGGSILLRLENTLEHPIRDQYRTQKPEPQDEFTNKAAHVAVDLKKLFLQLSIKSVRETTLAANQWLDDARQMDWSTRYVYSGADDGLLPEDAEETEDRHGTSDEHQEDSRRKHNPYTKPGINQNKLKSYHNYEKRKKRDVNTTKSYLENLINDTSNDNEIKYNNYTTFHESSTYYTTLYTQKSIINNSNKTSTKKLEHTTQKSPKLSFFNRIKTKVMTADWMDGSEEIMSSEEDFSANLKKRSPKKKNARIKKSKKQEEIIYDTDDGITKSIYEMYYKPKNSYQSSERIGEEFRKKIDKQTIDYDDTKNRKRVKSVRDKLSVVDRRWRVEREDDYVEDLKRRVKENPDDKTKGNIPPKSQRIKKDYGEVRPQDYYDEEDYIPYSPKHQRREGNRRKRALNKDETQDSNASDQAEDSEYVITLRPTQIRTFVIWYEPNRKSQRVD